MQDRQYSCTAGLKRGCRVYECFFKQAIKTIPIPHLPVVDEIESDGYFSLPALG